MKIIERNGNLYGREIRNMEHYGMHWKKLSSNAKYTT